MRDYGLGSIWTTLAPLAMHNLFQCICIGQEKAKTRMYLLSIVLLYWQWVGEVIVARNWRKLDIVIGQGGGGALEG